MDMKAQSIGPILVPIDGSLLAEQAVPYAQLIAEPASTIRLFRAVPDPESVFDPIGSLLISDQEVRKLSLAEAEQDLKEVVGRWSDEQYAALEYTLGVGDAAGEILHLAKEIDAGLIVMASSGRGAFKRLALGSVTDRVMRNSQVPVVVIRSADALEDLPRPLLRRLVVPLDGSARALSAVPVAAELARRQQASVHLVTILDFAGAAPPALAYGAAYSQVLYDEIMSDAESAARRDLEAATRQLTESGINTTWEVLTGRPAELIMDVTVPGDFIVMTSHGRGGFQRWLVGSVAEKLVRHSPVPVVIVPARTGTVRSIEQPVPDAESAAVTSDR